MVIDFYLKSKKEAESKVIIAITINKVRLKKTLPIKSKAQDWNGADLKKSAPTHVSRYINALRTNLEAYFDEKNRLDSPLTSQDMILQVEKEINPDAKIKPKPKINNQFFDLYAEFVKQQERERAPKTVAKYRTLKNFLLECNPDLKIEEANELRFINKFKYYLLEQDMENVTANKYLSCYTTFMGWLKDNKHITEVTKFKYLKSEEKPPIALLDEEFDTLAESNLKPRLNRVVKIFLFAAQTGFRFEDSKIKPDSVTRDKQYVEILIKKTGLVKKLKLIPEALAILEELNYDLEITNQKFNEYIKEAFKALKLNRPVTIISEKGSTITSTKEPLCDIVGSHIARATFITRLLRRGVPVPLVMSLSGHTTWKSFKRYCGFDLSEADAAMLKLSSKI